MDTIENRPSTSGRDEPIESQKVNFLFCEAKIKQIITLCTYLISEL